MGTDFSDTNDFYCDFVLNDKIKVKKEIETEKVLAFHHTNPSWTTHIVVIPKDHVAKLTEVKNLEIIREIFEVIQKLVEKHSLEDTNFKIITNGGDFQDSKHLHFHLLSGQPL
jgi:histidine triad (HIT) family protein